jgi:hypothetical protein
MLCGLGYKLRLGFVPLRLAPGLLLGGKLSTSDVSALLFSDALGSIELGFELGRLVKGLAVVRHKEEFY